MGKLRKYKIGDFCGIFQILNHAWNGKKSLYTIKCKCGNIRTVKGTQFQTRKYCPNCVKNVFPGKVIDGITLISRAEKGKWTLKCKCGKIYESQLKKRLFSGKLNGCGCDKREASLSKARKKIGLKYKYLRITKVLGFTGKSIFLELKCVCGNTIKRPNGNEFKSESCGCKWHTNGIKGEEHFFSKLKNTDVLSMRELHLSGLYSIKELSKIFSITPWYTKAIIEKKKRVNS